MGGSGSCTVATILHEMGHTVGVWHEQTRPDRNTYVNVNYNAVIKASRSNFDQLLDNDQNSDSLRLRVGHGIPGDFLYTQWRTMHRERPRGHSAIECEWIQRRGHRRY